MRGRTYFIIIAGTKEENALHVDEGDWEQIERVSYKESDVDVEKIQEYNFIMLFMKDGSELGPLPTSQLNTLHDIPDGRNVEVRHLMELLGVKPY